MVITMVAVITVPTILLQEKDRKKEVKNNDIVDLHSHILPGVDDGSPDLETSLELARESVADGITHMLLTPHHMDSNYVNHKRDVIEKTKAFQQILDREQIPLRVFPGQEVHLTEHLIEAIDMMIFYMLMRITAT